MITTEFYDGQGLGNQLWCYITTRCHRSRSRALDFGIINTEKIPKVDDFLDSRFRKKSRRG